MLLNDLFAADFSVHVGKLVERAHHRLGEKRHEAQTDAVPLLKRLASASADGHDGRHVRLIEGGEHGGGALRFEQPAGDRLAASRHANPGFAALSVARR